MEICKPDLLLNNEYGESELFKMSLEFSVIKATLFASLNSDLVKLLTNNTDPKPEALYPYYNMRRMTSFVIQSPIKVFGHVEKNPVITYSTSLNMKIVNLLHDQKIQYYIKYPLYFHS